MPLSQSGFVSRRGLMHPEAPAPEILPYELVLKFNPNHDASGRFASAGGGRRGGTEGAPTRDAFGRSLPKYSGPERRQGDRRTLEGGPGKSGGGRTTLEGGSGKSGGSRQNVRATHPYGTPEEIAAANKNYMTKEQYAKNAAAEEALGRVKR